MLNLNTSSSKHDEGSNQNVTALYLFGIKLLRIRYMQVIYMIYLYGGYFRKAKQIKHDQLKKKTLLYTDFYDDIIFSFLFLYVYREETVVVIPNTEQ